MSETPSLEQLHHAPGEARLAQLRCAREGTNRLLALALALVCVACAAGAYEVDAGGFELSDAGPPSDASMDELDAAPPADASHDAGSHDAGVLDAGSHDGGMHDAGPADLDPPQPLSPLTEEGTGVRPAFRYRLAPGTDGATWTATAWVIWSRGRVRAFASTLSVRPAFRRALS